MDKQAREAKKMAKDLPFGAKVTHIWEYYKWWIIGTIATISLIGGTIHEIVTRPTYDLEIGFYSDSIISEESITALEQYLAQYVNDKDGDGQQSVKIYNVSLSGLGDSMEAEMAVQSKFMAELSSGAYPVFLFDSFFYDVMQGESYQSTMESYRNLADLSLPAEIQIPEEIQLYWATRALYENETRKEEKVSQHAEAVELEEKIFGAR